MTAATDHRIAVSAKTAAEQCDCSEDFIKSAIRAGELPAKRIGQKYSIKIGDLEAWHDQLPDA
ncbi:excisionase family DNA-binding protein [Nakamurella aerolata]|uniref:Excisionase family DNA-binding protein n=1 Tax=Nakamurella aerolata TaxID=1656892 RepID=A0A849ABE2_9ACTN|nr:excisionase family DNA-binding protein [Nakamurella aerolata]NNG36906.1 excisionase family DNA-binding protein [Nakamurella aerolata]